MDPRVGDHDVMNLRSIDLNLLVLFDALITERNVTRAAAKVALSQPAMSNALVRLRHIFKDELFIRSARGIEPTERALELGEQVRQILRQTQRLLTSAREFDPSTDARTFTVRMSDLIGFLALPGLLAALRREAPGLRLDVEHTPPDLTVKALEDDVLDFALSMNLTHGPSIYSEPIFDDRMVWVMRRGHPLDRARVSLAKFVAADHVRIAMSPTDIRFVDNILTERGLARNIAANLPHWLLIPPILRQTDLVAVVSGRLAAGFGDAGLSAWPLPYRAEKFEWRLYWHCRHEGSKAHRWLRDLIVTESRAQSS